jgi:hypothetical protein
VVAGRWLHPLLCFAAAYVTISEEKQHAIAVAYLRTSSKANVRSDKDSDKRQLAAIQAYLSISAEI